MENEFIRFLKFLNRNEIKFVRFLYTSYLKLKLKEKNFTLITNNCTGGIIYHRLGLKFNSPTINFYFPKDEDYVCFVHNLDLYTQKANLVHDKENSINFPIGLLIPDDKKYPILTIHFIHDSSFEYVYKKWEERKIRIIIDKTIVIFDLSFPPFPHINQDKYIKDFQDVKYPFVIFLRNTDVSKYKNVFSFKVPSENIKVGSHTPSTRIKTYLDQFNYVKFINKSLKKRK